MGGNTYTPPETTPGADPGSALIPPINKKEVQLEDIGGDAGATEGEPDNTADIGPGDTTIPSETPEKNEFLSPAAAWPFPTRAAKSHDAEPHN